MAMGMDETGPPQRPWQDLRMSRLIIGLLLVPLPPIIFFSAAGATGSSKSAATILQQIALALGLAEAMALGIGIVYLAFARHKGRFGQRSALVFGAVNGFFLLFAYGLARELMASWGWLEPAKGSFSEDILAEPWTYLMAGGLFALPGMLGGWLLWRIAAGRMPTPVRLYRRWEDLSFLRLAFGLAVPPLIPATLAGAAFLADSNHNVQPVLYLLAAGPVWTLSIGAAYLLLVARRRGRLRRLECLLVGTLLACAAPFAYWLIDLGFGAMLGDPLSMWSDEVGQERHATCAVVAIVLAPFGALGGWLLWRIALVPAKLPLPDVTAVFD